MISGKVAKDFSEMTEEEKIEKLKRRKQNYGKLMHEETGDNGDKVWYGNEILWIDWQIRQMKNFHLSVI